MASSKSRRRLRNQSASQAALVLEIARTRSRHSCVSSLPGPARLPRTLPPFCIDAARAFNKCLVRRFMSVVRQSDDRSAKGIVVSVSSFKVATIHLAEMLLDPRA